MSRSEGMEKATASDGSVVAARLPNQVGRGGSIPTSSLHVRVIPWVTARQFVRQHHYLRNCSPIGRVAYGVFADDQPVSHLIGVIVYSLPPNISEDQFATLELQRMVILDVTTKNAESRTLAVTIRDIRRRFPEVRRIIAYADPSAGHNGTIYRATGFRYCGLSAPGGTTHRPERRGRGGPRTRKHKFEVVLRGNGQR